MRAFFTALAVLFAAFAASAQEAGNSVGAGRSESAESGDGIAKNAYSGPAATPVHTYDTSGIAPLPPLVSQADSLHLPAMSLCGQVMPIGMYPLACGGWYDWDLHKGLNVNVGASVFAQFGKNARRGAGFSQNISMMYAAPLTGKLSLAVGGYLNNTFWARSSFRDAGLSAVLGYKFNERWEAYVYGQKSLVDNRKMPLCLRGFCGMGDRIGAAVKYNFSESSSIQISVESSSR